MVRDALDINRSYRQAIILAVDDLANQKAILSLLNEEYDVFVAHSKDDVFHILESTERDFSLIIFDLMAQGDEDLAALQDLKENAKYSDIPVLFSDSEPEKDIKALELGASEFLRKPYSSPVVLQARVRRLVDLYQTRSVIHDTSIDQLTGLLPRSYFRLFVDRANTKQNEKEFDMVGFRLGNFSYLTEAYGPKSMQKIFRTLGVFFKRWAIDHGGYASHDNEDLFYLFQEHQADYRPFLCAVQSVLSVLESGAQAAIKVGVYPNVPKGEAPSLLCEHASTAFRSIWNARDSIAFYDEEFRAKARFQEKLIHDFHHAVETKQFVVYFQPKYDITEEEPILNQAEALVRWEHPELGLLGPNVFVPLFERSGLIRDLDEYVINETCVWIKKWEKEGHPVIVSVNLSRIDVLDTGVEDVITSICKRTGVFPARLHLEVTESAYSEDREALIRAVTRLRDKGFHIEMDDFGSGYSSLNCITEIPFDVLKLDMAFIRNMEKGEVNKRIIKWAVDLAKEIGVPIVAEGVETKEQYDYLKGVGCDLIQGYYFSKPLPPDEFYKLVTKH